MKTIDAPPSAPPSEIAEAVWRELAVPSYDCEIGLVNGRRHVVRADSAALHQFGTGRANPIRRGAVWVCTGGARGITAYVAKELAQRFGTKLHLIGTSPQPTIPDSWRDASSDVLKGIKLEVMQAARAAGRNAVKAWQDTEKLLEIDRTLREFAAEGITATYHCCDASDRAALSQVLARIRAVDGPIEGVLHGAGVGKDARFDRKDPEKVSQCFRAKIDAALGLMDLTRHDPIKHFIGFGSISGRFGANGHTDYSAANDALAKLIDWYRAQRPEVNAVAFHWHAWGDVGMATKPETRLALEMVDMQFMPAREGLAHLFRELAAGAPAGEVLITDERYHRMFYPAETLSSTSGQAHRFPLIDEGQPSGQGVQQVTEVTLDPLREPFLIEHRLEDRPLLPVVVGMEMLAEAALKLANQGRVVALHNVEALNGLRFFSDRPQTARILSFPDGPGRYRCELTADFLSRDGRLIESNRGYLRGEVEIADSPSQKIIGHAAACPALGDADWQTVEYAERGSKFYLGPMLRACKRIHLGQGVLWGRMNPPMLQELAGRRRSAEGWIVPSAALDACLYAVGLLAWMQVQPGPSLPFRFGRIALGRLPHPGEECLVECRFLRQEGRYADFGFTLYGNGGDVILQVSDYRIVYLA
jgi:NAD(P)-dependent dehydrogenase (short-subunit alcohol dehydrogenase family)